MKENIFTIWFGGDMDMTRINSLHHLEEISECSIELITESNIDTYILTDHPLHDGFRYLSSVHKSDYLRCYLMNFYGGGYSDVKKTTGSWKRAFNQLRKNDELYGVGCICRRGHMACDYNWNQSEKNNYYSTYENKLMASAHMICKPNTKFTREWYSLMIKKMDTHLDELIKHPARSARESKDGYPSPRWEIIGDPSQYPIRWGELLGEIYFPLQVKYFEKINTSLPEFRTIPTYPYCAAPATTPATYSSMSNGIINFISKYL